jgi:hypothetical protein
LTLLSTLWSTYYISCWLLPTGINFIYIYMCTNHGSGYLCKLNI